MTYKSWGEVHGYEKFNNDMKANKIDSLILLCGKEGYLINWAIETLKKRYINPDFVSLDMSIIDCIETDIEEIKVAAETVPMISEKRIIVVKNFFESSNKDKKKDEIERILSEETNSSLVIFTYEGNKKEKEKSALVKYIGEKGTIYNFDILDRATLKGFIKKRMSTERRQISESLLDCLIDESGYLNKENDYVLYNLIMDMEKIMAVGEGTITEEDIMEALSRSLEKDTFALLDAISENKKERALKLARDIILSGEKPIRLMASIASQIELLLLVNELKQEGYSGMQIAKTLGVHEFRVKKALGFRNGYSREKLKKMLISAYDFDLNLKTGKIDGNFGIEIFIATA